MHIEGDDEYCIIIEDDLEMSPFWYTWLKKAWLKYGDREDIAGIALQVIIHLPFLLTSTVYAVPKNKVPMA